MTKGPLRLRAEELGIDVGAAVAPGPLLNEEAYARTLASEFTLVTTENALKFGPVHPERDIYDFSGADTIVEFAEANEMKVHAHVLAWHEQLAPWVADGSHSAAELADILREHVAAVVGRYRGRIDIWDVVNEAVHWEPPWELRKTIWHEAMGPDYMDTVFRWAREADPDAKLFYNDFGAEDMGPKSDTIYSIAKGMLERGVPIDGVGLQMHVALNKYPSPIDMAANIERIGELGLEVQITEMDVQTYHAVGTREDKLEAQAMLYGEVFRLCAEADACTAFITWGVADCHSWIPRHTGHPDEPLLFDTEYGPKPAYHALVDAPVGGTE